MNYYSSTTQLYQDNFGFIQYKMLWNSSEKYLEYTWRGKDELTVYFMHFAGNTYGYDAWIWILYNHPCLFTYVKGSFSHGLQVLWTRLHFVNYIIRPPHYGESFEYNYEWLILTRTPKTWTDKLLPSRAKQFQFRDETWNIKHSASLACLLKGCKIVCRSGNSAVKGSARLA
jgi:hypothetical protein